MSNTEIEYRQRLKALKTAEEHYHLNHAAVKDASNEAVKAWADLSGQERDSLLCRNLGPMQNQPWLEETHFPL